MPGRLERGNYPSTLHLAVRGPATWAVRGVDEQG